MFPAIVALLGLAGIVLCGEGLWIHAKAILAQVLLERAFAQTLTTGKPVKPWSWADTWPEARRALFDAATQDVLNAFTEALGLIPEAIEITMEVRSGSPADCALGIRAQTPLAKGAGGGRWCAPPARARPVSY